MATVHTALKTHANASKHNTQDMDTTLLSVVLMLMINCKDTVTYNYQKV